MLFLLEQQVPGKVESALAETKLNFDFLLWVEGLLWTFKPYFHTCTTMLDCGVCHSVFADLIILLSKGTGRMLLYFP